jgi:hypothetical protein
MDKDGKRGMTYERVSRNKNVEEKSVYHYR